MRTGIRSLTFKWWWEDCAGWGSLAGRVGLGFWERRLGACRECMRARTRERAKGENVIGHDFGRW